MPVNHSPPNSRPHRNLTPRIGFTYLTLGFCRATRAAASAVSAAEKSGSERPGCKECRP